ncbi:hypothetical protein BH10BDE1_BH10BDE1_31620 [soil metagenome]
MKTIFVISLGFVSSLSFAAPTLPPRADSVSEICYAKAESAVTKFVEPGMYDLDGILADDCRKSPRGNAVVCQVSASKGDGAASDSYLALLSADCLRVYRVELTGEE